MFHALIEQYNKYDRKEVYKLACTNCNKFYIGRPNRNFNTIFKEHSKDFRYAEGKSKFCEHFLNEGQEFKTIEETVSTVHLENNYRKINTLEEIKLLKAASSKYLLNDVFAGKMTQCTNFSPHQWFEPKTTAQTKQQTKIQNFKT